MRSSSSERLECPMCRGAGELSRAEILDRLGVKDFARVAQLSAEEAFRLLQQRHDREHQSAWSKFESELTKRTAELRERFKDDLRLAVSEKDNPQPPSRGFIAGDRRGSRKEPAIGSRIGEGRPDRQARGNDFRRGGANVGKLPNNGLWCSSYFAG